MLWTSLCKQPCLLLSVEHNVRTSKTLWWHLLNIGDNWILLDVTKIMPNAPEGFDDDCNFLIENPFMLRFIPRLQKLKLISFYQNFKIHRRVSFYPKCDEVKIFSGIEHHIRVSSVFSHFQDVWPDQSGTVLLKTVLRFFNCWPTE